MSDIEIPYTTRDMNTQITIDYIKQINSIKNKLERLKCCTYDLLVHNITYHPELYFIICIEIEIPKTFNHTTDLEQLNQKQLNELKNGAFKTLVICKLELDNLSYNKAYFTQFVLTHYKAIQVSR